MFVGLVETCKANGCGSDGIYRKTQPKWYFLFPIHSFDYKALPLNYNFPYSL